MHFGLVVEDESLPQTRIFFIPISLQPINLRLWVKLNSARSINQSLKYQSFTPSGCKDRD